jgi:sodium transport system permease protein
MRWDLLTILRDPKTLFTMFLLPLVAYPALLATMSVTEEKKQSKQAKQTLNVSAPPAFETWITSGDKVEIVPGSLDGEGQKQVDAEVLLPTASEPATVRYRGDRSRSRRAKKRLKKVLKRAQKKARVSLFETAKIPIKPKQVLAIKTVDVATDAQKAGGKLGRFLPLSLVLLALGGGLYTALDLFAGERERGTMETLLVSRVNRDAVTLAKFLLVLGATTASALLAMISLGVSLAMGWFTLPGESANPLSLGTLALVAILSIPLLVQLSAGLVAMAARVPDYKVGQFLSMPAMLVVLLPASIPLFPGVELGPLLALVPIANIALMIVEVLSATPQWSMVLLTCGATVVHTGAALWLARAAMGKESAVLGPSGTAARHAAGRFGVEAGGLFLLVVLLFWFIGQTAQSMDMVGGMIITQVFLVATPAVAIVAWLGLSQREVLQLKRPRIPDLGLAIIAGTTAPCVGNLVFELQGQFIPISEELLQQFSDSLTLDIPLWAMVVLFAVLPAICEELLFRGAILGLLGKSMNPVARCLITAALFGLLHLMLMRILPTAALGLILTAAAMRARSIVVPMVIHLLNNGIVIVGATLASLDGVLDLSLTQMVVGSAIAVAAVAGMGRGQR